MKKKKSKSDEGRGKQSKNERIENFLQNKYEFRFNIIKSKPEYRSKSFGMAFQAISKFNLNSFKRELDAVGINTSADNIRAILESDFSPKVHPVKEYFKKLVPVNPQDDGAIYQLVAIPSHSIPLFRLIVYHHSGPYRAI